MKKRDGPSLATQVRIHRMIEIMTEAAESSSVQKVNPEKKMKHKKYWHPEIIKACKAAKETFWMWKESGRDRNSQQYQNLMQAQMVKRSKQRQYIVIATCCTVWLY